METLFARDGRAFKSYSVNDKGQPVAYVRRPCWRCGGEGKSIRWQYTGLVCYRCGGERDDPVPETVRLYTAEKNAALDAAQAKRDEKKAAAHAERDRLEQLRRDSERAEVISAHRDILTKMRPFLPGTEDALPSFNGQQFLGEMEEQVLTKARALSEKQIAAVHRIVDRQQAEIERMQRVRFLGEVGERMDFELTLGKVYCDQISTFPHIYSYTVYCRTDDGCTVVYKGSNPATVGHDWRNTRDERIYVEGRKVRVKATVKKHYTSAKGDPVTVVNRPKVLEVIAEGEMPERYQRGDV